MSSDVTIQTEYVVARSITEAITYYCATSEGRIGPDNITSIERIAENAITQ